jgi:hypothetical protein
MPRRRSLTSNLYRAARLSNNMRAASRGPGAYAKRVVRRNVRQEHGGHWAVPEDVRTQVRRRLWRSDAPSAVVSSTEASASLPAALRSVAAKSFRFVGATRIRHARQGGLSRRRSGGPAPGPTYLARQARVPAESDFTTSSLGMFVDV